MRLRGALNPWVNVVLGLVLLAWPCFFVLYGYWLGSFSAPYAALQALVEYPLGILVGLPALFLNRKALADLCRSLEGRTFLSSQLALLDSRHGKNAVAYFYAVEYLAMMSLPWWPAFPFVEVARGGFFRQAVYLSANVLPFVIPVGRGHGAQSAETNDRGHAF